MLGTLGTLDVLTQNVDQVELHGEKLVLLFIDLLHPQGHSGPVRRAGIAEDDQRLPAVVPTPACEGTAVIRVQGVLSMLVAIDDEEEIGLLGIVDDLEPLPFLQRPPQGTLDKRVRHPGSERQLRRVAQEGDGFRAKKFWGKGLSDFIAI